jgi:hypothetical protein
MLPEDVDDEIEKLKARKIELTNKMNMTTSFDEKEELKDEIDRLKGQVEILEKFKGK